METRERNGAQAHTGLRDIEWNASGRTHPHYATDARKKANGFPEYAKLRRPGARCSGPNGCRPRSRIPWSGRARASAAPRRSDPRPAFPRTVSAKEEQAHRPPSRRRPLCTPRFGSRESHLLSAPAAVRGTSRGERAEAGRPGTIHGFHGAEPANGPTRAGRLGPERGPGRPVPRQCVTAYRRWIPRRRDRRRHSGIPGHAERN